MALTQFTLNLKCELNGSSVVGVPIEDDGTGIDPANLARIFQRHRWY
jgi:signal transduction histidine kinase